MSKIVQIALAALVSFAVVSNATAKVKPFTAEEKLYFDRASSMTGGPAGGGGGGGDGA